MLVPLTVVELEPNSYHFLVKARLNGNEVFLIVDTGASSSVIDAEFAQQIECNEESETTVYSFTTDNMNVKIINNTVLDFDNGSCFKRIAFAVIDLSKLRELYSKVSGYNIAGLLGSNFLLKHCNAINLKKRTLSLNARSINPEKKNNNAMLHNIN